MTQYLLDRLYSIFLGKGNQSTDYSTYLVLPIIVNEMLLKLSYVCAHVTTLGNTAIDWLGKFGVVSPGQDRLGVSHNRYYQFLLTKKQGVSHNDLFQLW